MMPYLSCTLFIILPVLLPNQSTARVYIICSLDSSHKQTTHCPIQYIQSLEKAHCVPLNALCLFLHLNTKKPTTIKSDRLLQVVNDSLPVCICIIYISCVLKSFKKSLYISYSSDALYSKIAHARQFLSRSLKA